MVYMRQKFTSFHRVYFLFLLFDAATGPCAVCMLARVEQERLESLKYDKATIYIKCVDDVDDGKSENDSEVSFESFYLMNLHRRIVAL